MNSGGGEILPVLESEEIKDIFRLGATITL